MNRLVASAFVLACLSLGGSTRIPDRPRETQQALAAISAVIEMTADEYVRYPGSGDGLVPVATILRQLDPTPKRLPTRDAWGEPILYWSDGTAFLLLSLGQDKRPEFAYDDFALPYEALVRGTVTNDPRQDIAFVCGRIWQGPIVGDRTRSRLTASSLRSISTAVQTYSIDNNIYPMPAEQIVELATIEADLSPIYIRVLPVLDAWDHPFLYWSDLQNFVLIGTGTDGLPDLDYDDWTAEQFLEFDGSSTIGPRSDFYLRNGAFVQTHELGEGTCP